MKTLQFMCYIFWIFKDRRKNRAQGDTSTWQVRSLFRLEFDFGNDLPERFPLLISNVQLKLGGLT